MRDYLIRIPLLILPYGFLVVYRRLSKYLSAHLFQHKKLLSFNKELRNIADKETCFILANGFSVSRQDLSLLKKKDVFSVSNGYLHKGFENLKPLVHLVPQITYHKKVLSNNVVKWFEEIHSHLPRDTKIIVSTSEYEVINTNGLFKDRQIYYLDLKKSFGDLVDNSKIDLTLSVPMIESVPVMAIIVAMYMG